MNIIDKYNEIINTLMSNDSNATWDEIMTEMEDNYDGDDVIKYSIEELVGALETALEDCDEEAREFYMEQYLKSKELMEG